MLRQSRMQPSLGWAQFQHIPQNGNTASVGNAPDPVAVLNGRRKGMKTNMQKTLEAVKAKVESS